MSTATAETMDTLSPALAKLDIDSEEDNVEIIITPKAKSGTSSSSSSAPIMTTTTSVSMSSPNSPDTDSSSDGSAFFDAASDKASLIYDSSQRRDSGFEEKKSSSKSKDNKENDGARNNSVMTEEEEDDEFVVPDKELVEKIVAQVEFYFSDASITKDAFLLKHVRRNKEGFVSLKLISCFKRVKHLTKDWRQVAYAIKSSSTDLEVNDVETKVRRKAALPETDETTPSRTVVAYNLPGATPSVESVAEVFNKFGEIALVRILRPGNPIPGDVKQFLGKHPEIGNCVCALVEFDKTEYAKKAVAESAQETSENWRGVKVLELALKPKREKPQKSGKMSSAERRRSDTSALSGSEREELEQLRRRQHHHQQQQQQRRRGSRVDVLRRDSYTWGDSSGHSGSDSDGSMLNLAGIHGNTMGMRRYSYVSSSSSPSSAGSMSPGSPCCSPQHHRGAPCFCFAQRRSATPFDFAPNAGVGQMLSPGLQMSPQALAPAYAYHQHQPRGSFDDGMIPRTNQSWRSGGNKAAHPTVYLAPAMVPGHHAPLSRRHSDAATGLSVPDNVLRLPRGPDPTAGRGFRTSHFAQWTQPSGCNRFQQKGRSGSVPTVVFTRYAPQEMQVQQDEPQYVYQPVVMQEMQPQYDESVLHQQQQMMPEQMQPVEVMQQPVEEQQQQQQPSPQQVCVAETIPEAPAAEAAATEAETNQA